ncbi:serine/threonine-protein kinase [Actinoplanes sp. NPDC051470]|uniref:serine/threonine-protein kinase n=1 Tax=Actinoplanes sp. NPDC051470 TaxID=3157224 RepID=UPI003448C219
MPVRKLGDGRYELDSPLARGGMGEVWLGRDTKLDREIAVKFIRTPSGGAPEPEQIRRFVRESRITARLQHPGVPAVYDGGTDEHGWPFLVMQRVPGISIAHLISEQGPLPIGWTAAVAAQVCAVLVAAHGESLIHRDLKPSNLMLEPDGCVKVLDFGLAVAPTLAAFSRITMTNQPVGSPHYMAPEQVEANLAEPATDLYALGCTIHEMLTGEPVFSGSTSISVMLKQVKESPPALRTLRADIPEALETLVLELLAKRPEDRPSSAEAVYQRLLPLAQDLGPIAGVLHDPAKTSPVRQYASVVSRVFTHRAEAAARDAGPSTPPTEPSARLKPPPVDRAASAAGPQAAMLRALLRKAHEEAEKLVRQSRFKQAADALGEVTRRAEATFGATDADVLRARHDLAAALFDGGDYRQAAPLYRAFAPDLAGSAWAELRYDCRLKEATCYALIGRTPDALRHLGELLADQRAAAGDDDPRTLELRKQIGLLLLGAGRRAEAQQTLTSLLDDLRRLPGTAGPDPSEVAGLLTSVGLIADDAGSTDPAYGLAAPVDDAWSVVLHHADDPEIRRLLRPLAARGLPVPVVGYELGDEGWPAEVAWPDARIAILWADPPDDPETSRRDRAYAACGWDARTAARWTADGLAERITE